MVNTLDAYTDSLLASTLTFEFLWVFAHNSQLSPSMKIYSQPNGNTWWRGYANSSPTAGTGLSQLLAGQWWTNTRVQKTSSLPQGGTKFVMRFRLRNFFLGSSGSCSLAEIISLLNFFLLLHLASLSLPFSPENYSKRNLDYRICF